MHLKIFKKWFSIEYFTLFLKNFNILFFDLKLYPKLIAFFGKISFVFTIFFSTNNYPDIYLKLLFIFILIGSLIQNHNLSLAEQSIGIFCYNLILYNRSVKTNNC